MRGPLQIQKMADLPVDQVKPSAPFSYCAVDFFGPFLIKEKRSEVKRHGVIFTCIASKGVHLETANSLSTSSFINALNRFLNRRRPVRQLRCDKGKNVMRAKNELKAALEELDQVRVQEYLVENVCEWIPFQVNVPYASHMGAVWERLIRTVRSTLETLLLSAGTQLDNEAFGTFMTEAECIVYSRPLSTNDLGPVHMEVGDPGRSGTPPTRSPKNAGLHMQPRGTGVRFKTRFFIVLIFLIVLFVQGLFRFSGAVGAKSN